jgi:molybdopterin/thiamine biosynthesis adenylyltransferase
VDLSEGRFARLEAIEWWDQARLAQSRVLVVGAGALGNEVLKNLALVGAGHVVVVDHDRVERSNLSRSVLFRPGDEGRAKAECAARMAREIYPELQVTPLVADVLFEVGLGLFRWADVVIGAVDNREARVFINGACARVGRPWIDGGIEALRGIVRGFAPPRTACYECTMSARDWEILDQRRSCGLVAARASQARGVPTTPTSASVIGALQVQEAVKLLHGLEALLGRGFVFEGAGHTSYAVGYGIKPDCGWHEPPPPIEDAPGLGLQTPLRAVWELGGQRLGGVDTLELGRELVSNLACDACGTEEAVFRPADGVRPERTLCAGCGRPRRASVVHSLAPGAKALEGTAGELGLPAWDVVWLRHGADQLGVVLGADRGTVLGGSRRGDDA